MTQNENGFTLVELIITMAVFITVLYISASGFSTILGQSAKLMKSEESTIEGVIGLEMLRHDIQQAGFGLPHAFDVKPTYGEAGGAPADAYNDSGTTTAIPRALVADNIVSPAAGSGILAGSDYLVIKGTTVGRAKSAQNWTYQKYGDLSPHVWASNADNIAEDTYVTVLRRTFADGAYTNSLVVDTAKTGSAFFSPQFKSGKLDNSNFNPKQESDLIFIYGLGSQQPRMPFNRADYFVARTSSANIPAMCAPNAGILYKSSLNTNGDLNKIPILDCVADMQVVFGWDLRNAGAAGTDGLIDTYSDADGTTVSGDAGQAEVQNAMADPETIRNSLKLVKVYIMAQNGRKDPNFTSPDKITVGDENEKSLTREYDVAANDAKNYRWKVYRVVVRPKNLVNNQ